jgi:hypothetical protein
MANAIKAQGTVVSLSNENATLTTFALATFAVVGGVHSIGPATGQAAEIETTSLASTAKEFLIGLPDNGNIALQMNALALDPGHTLLIAALGDSNPRWLKVLWSNGNVWSIQVFVKEYTWAGAVDGKVDANASFRTSGPWTRA